MAGTVTARVSVLLDVVSELPSDSDGAAVVCTVLLDEAVDDALVACWAVVVPNGARGCFASYA